MFRSPRDHHQADIQNVLGSVHIKYGREISLLQIMLQVQFLSSVCNWVCNINLKMRRGRLLKLCSPIHIRNFMKAAKF